MKHALLIAVLLTSASMTFGASCTPAAQEETQPRQAVEDTAIKDRLRIGETAFTVQIADTVLEQVEGLQHAKYMEPYHGMLFVWDEQAMQTFWMKNTLIPLDFVWIADDMVIGVTENVPTEPGVSDNELTRYRSPQPVDMVLEINAGEVAEAGIQVGDPVSQETFLDTPIQAH